VSTNRSDNWGEALNNWQEKLSYFEREISLTSDIQRKFELSTGIAECESQIQRIKVKISERVGIDNVNRRSKDVIIIPCSFSKTDRKTERYKKKKSISSAINASGIELELIEKRVQIKNLIQSGKFVGVEFSEGNRTARVQNMELYSGPDFGGIQNLERYLPAYKRYSGRCFQATEGEWVNFFSMDESRRPHVLVLSGLYGLFPIEEYIQNYDCHLTDSNQSTQKKVSSYWGDLPTRILISSLESLKRQGWVIRYIFDVLPEIEYKEVVNWSKVQSQGQVLRFECEKRKGREALEYVGYWLRHIVREPEILQNIQADKYYKFSHLYEDDEKWIVRS